MNKTTYFLLAIFLISGIFNTTKAQDIPAEKRTRLTHHMSAEEKALFHLVGKGFEATDPPPGIVRNIAEFDQMEGVLISYADNEFGISYDLIAAMSGVTMVTTVVETSSIQNSITNQYISHGVNMENVNFLVTNIDSYWSRDYGPWYVAYGEDQIGIVDFIYNRPRPNDNAIPPQMAGFLGIESFAMDLITAGGNYMTTGEGISACSDLTWEENPTLTPAEIDQMVSDYLGIDTYHVLPDPNNTYIDHIDCWGKFLGVNKVLIREVPQSHPQYDEIEETAAYFENQTSSWGYPFEVYRVWTPNNEPYTNSLILNDHVFVPIVNGAWDDEAIAVYQQAMPGYEILGFTGSWESTDALHCRTKGTADRNTLYVNHIPLLGVQDIQPEYGIEAEITAYSGQAIDNDNVKVHYWINGIMQNAITMTYEGGKFYSAILPAGQEGSEMAYYISAVDEGGNMANHPFIGEPDPHVFYVGEQLFPALVLGVSQINVLVEEGTIGSEEFEIQNAGQLDLSFELDYSTALFEDFHYELENGPSQFSWDSNTYTELGWTGFAVGNTEGEVGGWAIEYTWNTDQYYSESTFKVESPSGTVATIAAGLNDGTYTAELDAFNGEQMQGTWKIWIEDSYGDGGHQATNIMVTITRSYEIAQWLTLSPLSGFVSPNGSETVEVVCDATLLPVGNYEGKIFLSTNDPLITEIEIPVYFQVDVASDLNEITDQNSLLINFPNPFKEYTVFEINTTENNAVTLFIYNANGQLIRTIENENTAQGKTQIIWDGVDKSGATVNPGIYFYQMKTGAINLTGKLIKT